jgi:hypothetical protein
VSLGQQAADLLSAAVNGKSQQDEAALMDEVRKGREALRGVIFVTEEELQAAKREGRE